MLHLHKDEPDENDDGGSVTDEIGPDVGALPLAVFDVSTTPLEVTELCGTPLDSPDVCDTLVDGSDVGGTPLDGSDVAGTLLKGPEVDSTPLDGPELSADVVVTTPLDRPDEGFIPLVSEAIGELVVDRTLVSLETSPHTVRIKVSTFTPCDGSFGVISTTTRLPSMLMEMVFWVL